jgi:hypothetical protein
MNGSPPLGSACDASGCGLCTELLDALASSKDSAQGDLTSGNQIATTSGEGTPRGDPGPNFVPAYELRRPCVDLRAATLEFGVPCSLDFVGCELFRVDEALRQLLDQPLAFPWVQVERGFEYLVHSHGVRGYLLLYAVTMPCD